MNNWPEAHNNHGTGGVPGVNMGFLDGHVAFIPRGPILIKAYLASYGGPAQNTNFQMLNCPGLKVTTKTVSGRSVTVYSY